jgi:hypothetical protein
MSTTTSLDADEEGEHMDQKEYQSVMGDLQFFLGLQIKKSKERTFVH